MSISVPRSLNINYLPGITYLLEFDEVEMGLNIVNRVEQEFVDFLKSLSNIIKLVSALKRRNLRSEQPMPHAVIREILSLNIEGSEFKKWNKQCRRNTGVVSASVDKLFKGRPHHQNSFGVHRARSTEKCFRKARDSISMTKQARMINDLKGVIGKKKKPLWHTVALETEKNESDLLKMSDKGQAIHLDENHEVMGVLSKRHQPLGRSRSQQLINNIKALREQEVPDNDPTSKRKIDMLLAGDADFTSLDEYKAHLETLSPDWYRDLLLDTRKMGILYSEEVVHAFEILGQYHGVKKASIEFAKAKMCYLVVSLPVWDVCQMAFQSAAIFFLENILGEVEAEQTLKNWLGSRLLPFMVYPPIIAAEYVFGIDSGMEKQIEKTSNESQHRPSRTTDVETRKADGVAETIEILRRK